MPVEEVGEAEMEERSPSCPKAHSAPLRWQQEEEGSETVKKPR